MALEADRHSGWTLEASFAFTLSAQLRDALIRGIPLYFKIEFALSKPRWYWFDDNLVTGERTYRLSYQPLTQQYRISIGGLQRSFTSIEAA